LTESASRTPPARSSASSKGSTSTAKTASALPSHTASHDALDAGAITGPPGVEVIVYALEDSVIVAVRDEQLPFELPVALRQLATYSFETKYVVNFDDRSFGEACAAIEELLQRASALLPSFEVLRRGERGLGRDGRRRRFVWLRRLAAAAAR
jgi:hypothetical protein